LNLKPDYPWIRIAPAGATHVSGVYKARSAALKLIYPASRRREVAGVK
jgi:hypothetical protein